MALYRLSDAANVNYDDWQREIPALAEVPDDTLRQKAILAWDSATSSSTFCRFSDVPFNLVAPTYRLADHVNEVNAGVQALASLARHLKWGDFDSGTLLLAAILHDVDKPLLFDNAPDGSMRTSWIGRKMAHATVGAILLHELGLPDEVVHLVATHSPASSVRPRSMEGLILAYADLFAADRIFLDTDRSLRFHRLSLER